MKHAAKLLSREPRCMYVKFGRQKVREIYRLTDVLTNPFLLGTPIMPSSFSGQARSSVSSILLLSFLLPLNAWLPVQALKNITIDNSDSAVHYNDEWNFDDTYDSGATDHWSSSTSATATVNFTGVAVYYQVHMYPNNLQTGGILSVDNYPATSAIMWDPNNDNYGSNWTTVWQMTGLADGPHTLNVKYWDNGNNSFISLDTVLVTQLEDGDPVPVVPSLATGSRTATSAFGTSTSSFNAPDTASNTSSGSSKALPIALGTVFGLLFLGAAVAAAFFYYRSRQNRAATAPLDSGEVKPFMSSNTPPASAPYNPTPYNPSAPYNPYNPGQDTNMRQSLAPASGTSSYSFHSPSPVQAPDQAMTMSRLIHDANTISYPIVPPSERSMASYVNSSQTSLYGSQGPSSGPTVGAAMSARLPEV
ncbi:hypothetical protein D9758_005574 [Tetrapyrgos nigripes]|uniref:Uncharacterized protein n=1 Tax=Tetrapyrgos nigripes TaxID=182062 RepID=A0A8H5LPH1_9AGAR|nr:hypothetical protein D9758_005574 [Tetrapyrgos nigripes]